MDRVRLRPAHSKSELRRIYARPHDHSRWADHRLRVEVTKQTAQWLAGPAIGRAADLSCGDGCVLEAVPAEQKYYGDMAYGYPIMGAIEMTIEQLPPVDMFVCCETLEHLDNPDAVLAQIREKTRTLVLSTPVDAWGDANQEHYWAWSREGVEAMLKTAGFHVAAYASVDFRMSMRSAYHFGIWACR